MTAGLMEVYMTKLSVLKERIAADAPKPACRFTLISVGELLELPPPEWLIEGVIESSALGVLYGPPGCGKSFAALDWALSVATGKAWHGREVRQGAVVYVAGEGTTGVA